jgi:selenoprotein W-related protein
MTTSITIIYCTKCRWMLRATWIAQELLTTFEQEAGQVILKPDHSGGVFKIYANEKMIFERVGDSGFPEIKTLKQLVRDEIAPGKDLGHSDRK